MEESLARITEHNARCTKHRGQKTKALSYTTAENMTQVWLHSESITNPLTGFVGASCFNAKKSEKKAVGRVCTEGSVVLRWPAGR